MDPLHALLLERLLVPTPVAPTGLPALPPVLPPRLPPAWRRFQTALRMQDAYAKHWTPHPLLLRILSRSHKE